MNTTPELNSKDIRTVAYIMIVGVLVIILCLFWAARTINAQAKPGTIAGSSTGEPKYILTEVQLLKLQVQQKDAQLLQAQLQNIQRQFQEKVSDLMSTAQKFKLENGWPPDTSFNPDTLVFSAPPAKEEKK